MGNSEADAAARPRDLGTRFAEDHIFTVAEDHIFTVGGAIGDCNLY